MHFHLEKLAVMAAFAIGGVSAAYAQNAVEQLQPLVETTARRLMIGQQVALAKWDSGKVVEDTPREAQVILGAMKDGVAKGLDEVRAAGGLVSRRQSTGACAGRFVEGDPAAVG